MQITDNVLTQYVNGVDGVLTIVFVALWVMGSKKLRKTEQYAAFKAAKAAYKASKKK